MILYYEVHKLVKTDMGMGLEEMAAIDVTNMTDDERKDTLAKLRIVYGTDCQYRGHACGHLDKKACEVEQL